MAGLLAAALAGCGGGSDGAAGTAGAPGAPGAAGTPGKDLTAQVNVGSNATPATAAAAAAWKALEPKITITGVTINSAPVVSFTVKDTAGTPVTGLANYSQAATATVKSLTNVSFTLAKLVPAANGEPSKWVSYNVVRPLTVAEKTATPANRACDAATNATWCGTYPAADNQGTLVDNGNGSYTYTFLRDPKQAATLVASLKDSTDGTAKKADLGDVSFDANLTHRVGIMITGNAPGTGTNTPTAAASTTAAVAMDLAGNAVYTFIPATGKAVTVTDASRDIVNINTCASCHQSKGIGHGTRRDPQLCVTCHTDQTKFSFVEATKTGTVYSGKYARVGGEAAFTFPRMIHQFHMGKKLTNTGYDLNAHCSSLPAACFNKVSLPQDVRNCTVCHDGAATGAKAVKDGDNYKNVPSIIACGSCHDGIDFKTGLGTALGAKGKAFSGHVGGAQANNAMCAVCHEPATIPVYHAASATMPATAVAAKRTLSATIKSVAIPADGSVTVSFSLANAGVPVTVATDFSGMAFTLAKLVPEVNGAPSQWVSYLARTRTKDAAKVPVIQGYSELVLGQTAVAPTATATGRPALVGGTLTNLGSGNWSYKFALVNGAGSINTVTTAQNVSAFVNAASDYNFTKVATYPNVVAYEPTLTHRVGMEVSTAAGVNNLTNATFDFVPAGGAVVTTRNIVTMENCASCHAGRKIHKGYATQYCVTCHNQNTADPYYGDQSNTVELQKVVHKVHAKGAAYIVNGEDFNAVGYPGNIKNCTVCHVETNTAAKDAANWRTKPSKQACASCHDTAIAVAHMDANIAGGVQTCVTCHGTDKVGDIKVAHGVK